jgi:hypothetical protein
MNDVRTLLNAGRAAEAEALPRADPGLAPVVAAMARELAAPRQ